MDSTISLIRRRMALIVIGILAVSLQGCSNAPSPKEAEQVVKASIDQGGEQRLRLESFTKLDGLAAEAAGVKAYTLMFAAEAVFLADAQYTVGMPLTNEGNQITTAPPAPPSNGNPWTAFIAGSQGFHPAKTGDRLRLNGRVSFEKRESGWRATSLGFTFALDSARRGQVGQVGADANTPSSTGIVQNAATAARQGNAIASIEDQRCAEYALAHPVPTASWLDRLLRRSKSVAIALPDSEIILWAGRNASASQQESFPRASPLGSLSVLPSREVCVGGLSVKLSGKKTYNWIDSPDDYKILLSPPSKAKGYRFLEIVETSKMGLSAAWVVHPDSGHTLSADLIDSHVYTRDGLWRFAGIPREAWSPADEYVVVFFGHSPPDIVAIELSTGRTSAISLNNLLINPHPEWSGEGDDSGIAVLVGDDQKWTAPDILQLKLRLFTNYPAKFQLPPDSIATIAVDVRRGQASRLR